jgi:hypothetical protein
MGARFGTSAFPQFSRKDIASARLLLSNPRGEQLVTSPMPQRSLSGVLDALEPNHIDTHPMKWIYVGTLDVKLTNGAQCSILLYCTGEKEAAFSVDHTYFRGGSDRELIAALNRADRSWGFQRPDFSRGGKEG